MDTTQTTKRNLDITPGPWEIGHSSDANYMGDMGAGGLYIQQCGGGRVVICEMDATTENRQSNADLIAEAGTVANETGLTPRQLADQRGELLAALRWCVEAMTGAHPNGLPIQRGTLREEQEWDRAVIAACAAIANATA